MTVLSTMIPANSASNGSPTTSTTAASAAMMALKRVKTFERTISPYDLDVRSGTVLTAAGG